MVLHQFLHFHNLPRDLSQFSVQHRILADSLSVSASIVGLIGLAKEVLVILANYAGNVKSAHEDAGRLNKELTALCFVLDQMREFLRQENLRETCFNDTSVLVSTLGLSSFHVRNLFKKLDKFGATNSKVGDFFERMKWPLRQDECEKAVVALNRLAQYLQFSLTVSNWFVNHLSIWLYPQGTYLKKRGTSIDD
jgi:hypothetical protein